MFLVFAGVGGQHPRLWGRFSALNSRFKLLAWGQEKSNVYPTISIQLNNFTKQDPEPEHAVSMEAQDFDKALRHHWKDNNQLGKVILMFVFRYVLFIYSFIYLLVSPQALKFLVPTVLSLRAACTTSIKPSDVVKQNANPSLKQPERYCTPSATSLPSCVAARKLLLRPETCV